jgi:hypothetical protein
MRIGEACAAMAILAAATAIAAAGCKEHNPYYTGGGDPDAGIIDLIADGQVDIAATDGSDDAATDSAPDVPAGCQSNADCTGDAGGPACDKVHHTCVGCLGDGDCSTDGGPGGICDLTTQACVGCLPTDDPCAGKTPICNAATQTCRACKSDAECPANPGVCMDDGHCATDAEVFYVQKTSNCPGDGSLAQPLCAPQDAITAMTSARWILVLRGPDALDRLSIATSPANQVMVVGQDGAFISPGAGNGIQLSTGIKLFVRDMKVMGGAAVGVMASAGELHMDRCTVENNAKGGIQISAAGYDIVNTIIAKNGPGTDTGGVLWGGVRISSAPPAGAPYRFLNDTVADNNPSGVSCGISVPMSGLVFSGNVSADNVGCTVTACCGTGNPMLTADYHLMAGSPCIDKLDPSMSVPDDIDGQARPNGTMSDCGADEYYAP